MPVLLLALALFLVPWPAVAQEEAALPPGVRAHFEAFGAEGCFVGFEASGRDWIRHGDELCRKRFVPASTFKILNSLIVLEAGILEDADEVVEWDGVDRGWEAWNRSHDLESAFRYSVVWVYQELARRVGLEPMDGWVRRAGYGNAEVGLDVDRFWLDGPLRVSPQEQVEFLRRLARDDLPFSRGVMETVRGIMVETEGEGWTLRAKTGWGRPEGGEEVGWKVGWVERGGERFFFAVLIRPRAVAFPMRRAQEQITRGILEDLGVL